MPTVYGHEDRSFRLRIGQRVYDIPVLYLDQDGIDRIRLGYLCIACMQPHEVPFPEECAHEACRFPMRHYQDEAFEHCIIGPIRIGPQTSLSDEMEILREEHQRRTRERANKPQIWLPAGLRDGI